MIRADRDRNIARADTRSRSAKMSVGCAGRIFDELDVAFDANAHIGHHGIDEAIGDDANHSLDRFIGANELRRAASFEGELLEQAHIDV